MCVYFAYSLETAMRIPKGRGRCWQPPATLSLSTGVSDMRPAIARPDQGASGGRGSDHLTPVVSIITATYNRSNVLRYAIESVLHSRFEDWELVIVGDACTDDTEDVVESFGDPRIRFRNLETNFGDQSGPNNVGFEMARGRYIAYLNHDDLYFPDHLEHGLKVISETGADLVYAAIAIAEPRTPEALKQGDWAFSLRSISPAGYYEPYIVVPASAWILRRTLINSIGGWRPAAACYGTPSQDFLFRAWKAGKDLKFNPHITVLAIQSGARSNVYQNRDYEENAFYRTQILENPDFREALLKTVVMDLGRQLQLEKFRGPKQLLRRVLWRMGYALMMWLGISPIEALCFLWYRRRGKFIQSLRRKRGLEETTK